MTISVQTVTGVQYFLVWIHFSFLRGLQSGNEGSDNDSLAVLAVPRVPCGPQVLLRACCLCGAGEEEPGQPEAIPQ